ncbi:MAG: PDZ domain-containing protein [Ruminococcaceae bacterium]|nr:PDZ domain-containing protein [Oscillospiraceae bacterium]
MNDKKHKSDLWEQDSYETGSTRPPKNRGGLIAILLVLVIMLCGVSSALGVLNIRLGRQLQQVGKPNNPIAFHPPESAFTEHPELDHITDCLLPGVEGRTLSSPEQSFYHWPAGVVVTQVTPGSNAAGAGLTIGDILTACNRQSITDTADLNAILRDLQPGSAISLTIFRDGSALELHFSLDATK